MGGGCGGCLLGILHTDVRGVLWSAGGRAAVLAGNSFGLADVRSMLVFWLCPLRVRAVVGVFMVGRQPADSKVPPSRWEQRTYCFFGYYEDGSTFRMAFAWRAVLHAPSWVMPSLAVAPSVYCIFADA